MFFCWFLSLLTLQYWSWRQYFPPKRRQTITSFSRLFLVSCWAYTAKLKVKVVRFSETSVQIYQATWSHIPKYCFSCSGMWKFLNINLLRMLLRFLWKKTDLITFPVATVSSEYLEFLFAASISRKIIWLHSVLTPSPNFFSYKN